MEAERDEWRLSASSSIESLLLYTQRGALVPTASSSIESLLLYAQLGASWSARKELLGWGKRHSEKQKERQTTTKVHQAEVKDRSNSRSSLTNDSHPSSLRSSRSGRGQLVDRTENSRRNRRLTDSRKLRCSYIHRREKRGR